MPASRLDPRLASFVFAVAVFGCTRSHSPQPDAGAPWSGHDGGGRLDFAAPCTVDAECGTGICKRIGIGRAICSHSCDTSSDCPHSANWSCCEHGGGQACGCVPDAIIELCGDGIDNDCDGSVDDCAACDGVTCAPGQSCEAGECHCNGDGEVACGDACVVLASSTEHCGGCGNACATGASCVDSACSCPAGQTSCEGACVELESDESHCGECGAACAGGATCEAGACACRGDQLECSGVCADLATDESHCGACGVACSHLCLASGCDEPVEVAGAWLHACARTREGLVACWGSNEYGQVGADTGATPFVVPLPLRATAVAPSGVHTCALLENGAVWCWGSNDSLQLGRPTSDALNPPGAVDGITDAIAITTGQAFSCALHAAGTVSCWGYGWNGQLGPPLGAAPTPRTIAGVSGAIAISAGYEHTCALLADRTAVCWGANLVGQLGRGTVTDYEAAAPVPGLAGLASIESGYMSTCAVTTAGAAYCWGDNTWGQLGIGSSTNVASPTALPSITTAVSISAGTSHTCVVLADGTARCAGAGEALGDGTGAWSELATVTPALVGIDRLDANYSGTWALADGVLWVWGTNTFGKLQRSTGDELLSPVRAEWTP